MRLTSCRTKNEFKDWLAIKIAWMLPRQVQQGIATAQGDSK